MSYIAGLSFGNPSDKDTANYPLYGMTVDEMVEYMKKDIIDYEEKIKGRRWHK